MLADGQWVRAGRQTLGHGRGGRAWQSPAGNISMSALIRLQPGEGSGAELGFVAALALHELCAELVAPSLLQLKWPNDVLLDGGKVSGILLEMETDALILGIGVNLAAAPEVPGRRVTALADYGVTLPAGEFAVRLAAAFASWRGRWRTGGFAAIREVWLQHAHPLGTTLEVRRQGSVLPGRFAGLAANGALLLETMGGAVETVYAGEIWQPDATGAPTAEGGHASRH